MPSIGEKKTSRLSKFPPAGHFLSAKGPKKRREMSDLSEHDYLARVSAAKLDSLFSNRSRRRPLRFPAQRVN
jgi:hypothetical protein